MKAHSQISLTCHLIFFFFIVSVAEAQIGVKAGAGFSDIVFADEGQAPYLGYEVDYLEHRNPLFSYQFGGFYTLALSKRFDFQPEVLFARQGLNYDINFIYDEVVYRLHIWYLRVPLLFRLKMNLQKKSHPILFVGPYGAINLKSTRITEYDGNRKEEDMANVKTYDLGITFGFGYDFELPKGDIMIELRCDYSLMNMMNYTEGHIPAYDGPTEARARNVSLTFMLAYRFANISNKKE